MLWVMNWVYLALLAPFLTAIVSLFDDNLLRHVYKGAHAGVIVTGLFAIVPALAIVLLGLNDKSLPPHLIGLSVVSGFLAMIAVFYYFKGLELENPSVVAALFSLTPAVMPFLAHYFVGERLSARAAIGFTIVIIAGFLYSLEDVKNFNISKALGPVLLASAMFDISSLTGKYSYDRADFYSAYLFVSVGMVLAGLVFLAIWRFAIGPAAITGKKWGRKRVMKLLPLLAFVEVLGLGAEFAYNKALSQGPVSLINAIDNTQPLFMLLIALALYPLYPKYFREAESDKTGVKILLGLVLVTGIYIAVA